MTCHWTVVLLTGAILTACDRAPDDAPPDVTSPAPASSHDPSTFPATTTGPATTQVVEAMIDIDGTMVLFPPARVRLDDADGKLVARLFSDDPKHALDENYEGNSFYLQLDLDAGVGGGTDDRELAGMVLTYRSPTSERDDSPYGIFLEGRRWVLQPSDVRVTFDAPVAPGTIDVQLNGVFLLFDSLQEGIKPKRAIVTAKLPAVVQGNAEVRVQNTR